MPKGKNFTIFFLSRIVNHPNTTLFDVFEKSFLMKFTGKHRQNLSLIQTFFIPIQPRKQDSFWPVMKNFRKTKKPWPQTNDRRSLAYLAWQSRSPGYFVNSLVWVYARLLPLVFSHSQNTFLRDMKPNLGLFVLLSYHILPRFTTKAAVSKPQQNRNLCHQNRNKPRISLPFLDIFVPFGSGMVGERHCPSKARSNIEWMKRR